MMKNTWLLFGLSLLVTWSPEVVEATCRSGKKSSWISVLQGPKVVQKSPGNPTEVVVSWERMIKNPECVDAFHIKLWRKDVDAMNARAREIGPISKTEFKQVVANIDPCMDYYFTVEFEIIPRVNRPFKVKGGKTIFKTTASPSLVSSDPNNVRVEYLYRRLTDDFDMNRAVLKFNKNAVVKYPNCLEKIDISVTESTSTSSRSGTGLRYKRTIGQVYTNPFSGSSRSSSSSSSRSSTSSSSRSSYSSSSSSSSSSSRQSSFSSTSSSTGSFSLRPPFRGQNDDVELTFGVKPCAQYTIKMALYKARGVQVGKVENIRMKSIAEIPNFRLPPITKVLSVLPSVVSPKVQVRFSSPIPASCLEDYLKAVDVKLKQTGPTLGGSCSQGGGGPTTNRPAAHVNDPLIPINPIESPILKQHGCVCKNTSMVNLTSADPKVVKTFKPALGLYKFEGQLHEGKPYYVKRSADGANFIYYVPKVKTWYLANALNSTRPLLKLDKNAATSCPENPTTKKWHRKNAFGIWVSDKTMKLTCDAFPVTMTPRPPYMTTARPSYTTSRPPTDLAPPSCACGTVNLTSSDSRVLKKHKVALGAYKFNGSFHETKPYYMKRTGLGNYYLYRDKSQNTWYLSKLLGSKSPILKLDKNAGTPCAETPTLKKWQRKSAFGFWGADQTMKVACLKTSVTTARPSYPSSMTTSSPFNQYPYTSSRPSYSTTARPTYRPSYVTTARPSYTTVRTTTINPLNAKLKNAGCKCHKVSSITVSSTDSRTVKKHKDELGQYLFEGTLYKQKPVYEKSVGSKRYYVYFDSDSKSWRIGDAIGSASPLMKTGDKTDQVCPADPTSPKSQKWKRKNWIGAWGKDTTMVIKCL